MTCPGLVQDKFFMDKQGTKYFGSKIAKTLLKSLFILVPENFVLDMSSTKFARTNKVQDKQGQILGFTI